MKRLLYYNYGDKQSLELLNNLLSHSLPMTKKYVDYELKIANITTHGLARVFERGISEIQKITLQSIAKNKTLIFSAQDVSELRVIELNTVSFVVSIVINDISFAIQPINFLPELTKFGLGIREGDGYGVIKTALEYPNIPQPWNVVNGWTTANKIKA